MDRIWKKIYNDDGTLIYEGFTLNNKAYGAGVSYYENGNPLHEGVFGIKGLLIGREYYPNGNICFEGVLRLNRGYGPNWPEYGTWYSEDGEELFHGKFGIRRGGVGFPTVTEPMNYGMAHFKSRLDVFMWEDAKRLGLE